MCSLFARKRKRRAFPNLYLVTETALGGTLETLLATDGMSRPGSRASLFGERGTKTLQVFAIAQSTLDHQVMNPTFEL